MSIRNRDKYPTLSPQLRYYYKNKDKIKEYTKKWAKEHPDKRREYRRKEYLKAKMDKNLMKKRIKIKKDWELRLKIEVLSHYSNNKIECQKCGTNDVRILVLNHERGGGSRDRKQLNKYGMAFYNYLKRQNYPSGFNVLCRNCDWIERLENINDEEKIPKSL